jgi:hypothetical protein
MASRVWIQSCVRGKYELCPVYVYVGMKRKKWGDTYRFVDIPAPVLAALLGVGHALVHAEVPVHVGRLLAAALLVGLEAATTLGTRRAEVFVELGDHVRAKARWRR